MNNALTTIITNTAARPPGGLESMPLFSSVSCCRAFSFQGCSISLLPRLLLWAALWLWCPVWGSRDVGSGQVLIYAAAVVCEALQRVYSNSLCLPCAITQKAKYKPWSILSAALLMSLWGGTLLLCSFRCLSGCCIPCKRKVLFLSLQSFTYGVITPIVILGFQKGSKQRFCTPLCRTKSVVSECKSLLLTCIIMLSLWLSSLWSAAILSKLWHKTSGSRCYMLPLLCVCSMCYHTVYE